MSLESGYTARLIVHRDASRGGNIEIDFEEWEGGSVNPAEVKHRSAQGRQETARGGLRSRTNPVLRRECDSSMWAIKNALEDSSGIDRATAIRQMVDARGSAIGDPLTVTGILHNVNYPPYNLSGDQVGILEVEVSADEQRG